MTQRFFNPMRSRRHAPLIKRLLRESEHGLQTCGREGPKLGHLQYLALIKSPLSSRGFRAQPTLKHRRIFKQKLLGGNRRAEKSIR